MNSFCPGSFCLGLVLYLLVAFLLVGCDPPDNGDLLPAVRSSLTQN